MLQSQTPSSQPETDHHHRNMFNAWILLSPLLLGANAFMIHNMHHGLCLEDSLATGDVLLQRCDLDSDSQQWIWMDQGMLMGMASSRCLSAVQREPLQTLSCKGPGVVPGQLMWDCDRDRLISRNTSMLLSIAGWQLIFTHDSKYAKWRSLDEGDICQEKLRSRRASDDPEEFDTLEKQTGELPSMTEEEKEYLRWYYRTADPTTWKFVLLGLAFVCLLIGFLLLGMGAMANKNRKKIAKYKAAAAMAHKSAGEELVVISPLREDSSNSKASPSNGEVSDLIPGDIVVTWKDGNTSSLYSDPTEEAVADIQVEVLASEPEADEAEVMVE